MVVVGHRKSCVCVKSPSTVTERFTTSLSLFLTTCPMQRLEFSSWLWSLLRNKEPNEKVNWHIPGKLTIINCTKWMAIPLLAITINHHMTNPKLPSSVWSTAQHVYHCHRPFWGCDTGSVCSVKLPSRNPLGRLLHWLLPHCQETGLKFVPRTTTYSQNLSIQTLSDVAIESVHMNRVYAVNGLN